MHAAFALAAIDAGEERLTRRGLGALIGADLPAADRFSIYRRPLGADGAVLRAEEVDDVAAFTDLVDRLTKLSASPYSVYVEEKVPPSGTQEKLKWWTYAKLEKAKAQALSLRRGFGRGLRSAQ